MSAKTLPVPLRELRELRRAAKHRSRTGPQEDAQFLWERVRQIEARITAMETQEPAH
jgi:hypothetical protein